MKIVHLTSAHTTQDARILHKMCCSFAQLGYEAHYIVPAKNPMATEYIEDVMIHQVALPENRIKRMFWTARRVLSLAESLAGDIYHFHDPEFLLFANSFKKRVGKPVIYDAHEDLRLDILQKHWIPKPVRRALSLLAGQVEDMLASTLSGVVAATPTIAERFSNHPNCIVVQNFPVLREFNLGDDQARFRQKCLFAYVGGLEEERGILEIIKAIDFLGDATLKLAGTWGQEAFRNKCQSLAGWTKVQDVGFLNRANVCSLLHSAVAGLVVLRPTHTYLTSYPVKMFEYMAAGLPVIASDFPLWRSIIDESQCGILVDPLDPKSIAHAMRRIIDHPEESEAMGRRGREAILKKFNWKSEFSKLRDLYAALS